MKVKIELHTNKGIETFYRDVQTKEEVYRLPLVGWFIKSRKEKFQDWDIDLFLRRRHDDDGKEYGEIIAGAVTTPASRWKRVHTSYLIGTVYTQEEIDQLAQWLREISFKTDIGYTVKRRNNKKKTSQGV